MFIAKKESNIMKVCNTEAMKLIKEYEEQKRNLFSEEEGDSYISYKEGETKLTNGYDYEKVRLMVRELDQKVRAIRAKIAAVNCKKKIDGFDITIGEALVMLAQLQCEREQIEMLATRKQISRRLTMNGVLEFTECLYDTEKAKQDVIELRKKISELQMAIDRANLNTYIEI